MVKNKSEIDLNIKTNEFLVLDARSEERFFGKVSDPRKNVRSGSIPNSHCLPFTNIIRSDKTFKNIEEIKINVSIKSNSLSFAQILSLSLQSKI